MHRGAWEKEFHDQTTRESRRLTRRTPSRAVDAVFVGSSILSEWPELPAAFPGMSALNSAVSGAQTPDLRERLDELVLRHAPRLVVYYAGSNDINADVAPATVVENVIDTWERIRKKLADTAFVYLSIIRAPQKQDRLAAVDTVNVRLLRRAFGSPNFHFVDINPLLVNADGQPRAEFYQEDGLHLTPAAYQLLGAYLAPRLQSLLD